MCLLLASGAAARAQEFVRRATADGKPDLNGIWQAVGAAHWDVEAHNAREGPVRRAGRARRHSRRSRRGRGRRDPVPALGAGEASGEPRRLAEARSRDQVLHARHPSRHLHAVPVPDRADTDGDPDGVRVRRREPHRVHGSTRLREPRRHVDGALARPLGGGDAGGRRHQPGARHLARQLGQLPQREAARGRALHREEPRTTCSTRSRSRTRRCTRVRGR